nr:Uncharacterised protein [Providencia rettgeri]
MIESKNSHKKKKRIKKFTSKKKKIIFTSEAKESTFIHTTNKVFELKKKTVYYYSIVIQMANGKTFLFLLVTHQKINNSYPNKFDLTLDENELIIEASKKKKKLFK